MTGHGHGRRPGTRSISSAADRPVGGHARVTLPSERNLEFFTELGRGFFPEYVGFEVTEVGEGLMRAELTLRPEHMAPNGYLHAGVVVTLADTTAGYGCVASLPENAVGFTTIDLSTSFLRTARDGVLRCEARAAHLGRTTQLWDATVAKDGDKRPLALFRCTQLVLYDR
jgi:1,4-dihydroxy-2-naphthoyl-CoA hydrolase